MIHRVISRGGPASLDDVRAVARTLARACGLDEYTVAADVTALVRPSDRPSRPLLVPRSAYLAQVRQIAPPELLGRAAELAELARFCLDERAGPYVWWQAGPWAGKSALLSTFALNPPEEVQQRVRVVAFFITARFAAQDTRQAFTAVVAEQLTALTGQQVPGVIDESLREAWLLDLLGRAAQDCEQRGVRLVLLVDGLDEDRGVTTGPHARSIAGLLPGVPPAGMRIIVAGRPNPPVPDDVPDWHPLREAGIIRPLSDSPYARDLQRLGQIELKRLLTGSEVEQDLLGLLTVARGGLSSDDLHELTGAGLVEIEEVLHTVAGRAFTRRSPQRDDTAGRLVYLLGHEELATAARRYLSEPRQAGYRDRLHRWAERYRSPGSGRPWPPNTPEYLLLGYPRMLNTTGDVSRLVDLVTDSDRHDRMLDLTGGDAAALTEITTCQDLVMARPEIDLQAMLRLCIRRTSLADRNSNIPTSLPAVWAYLRQPARAEALACSVTDPLRRVQALAAVTRAVAAAGDTDRVRPLADHAETVARSITDPDDRAEALVAVAVAIAAAGDAERAEAVARSITDPPAQALVAVAEAIAAAGAERAEAVARSITDPHAQVLALAAVAGAVAASGDTERALQLAGRIETRARSIEDLVLRARVLVAVAEAIALAGDADRAETVARSIGYPDARARALVAVAEAIAAAGDADRAETVARSINYPDMRARARALAAVAGAVAAAGDTDRACRLADRAERMARSIGYPDTRARALAAVAEAIAAAGDTDRAETVARSVTAPHAQAQALAAVAGAVAAAGDTERALQLAARTEALARSIATPLRQVLTLAAVVGAVATAGDAGRARRLADRAEAVARGSLHGDDQVRALVTVAQAVAAADPERAEALAHSFVYPGDKGRALAAVAGAIAVAGDTDRAETMIRSISTYANKGMAYADEPTQALIVLVQAVTAAGDTGRARQLTGRAVAVTDRIPDLFWLAGALTVLARAAVADNPGRAETVARSITYPYGQVRALAAVTRAIAATGDADRARRLADHAETVARSIPFADNQAAALAAAAEAIAATGDAARAEALARSISDPHTQLRALAAVAGVVASASDAEHAGRLMGAALAGDSWQVSLPVLAEHWPRVVLRCVDGLSGDEHPHHS